MGLREAWAPGRLTLGGWCAIGNPFSAELMARSGYDWICIDLQHGLVSHEQMVGMLQAASGSGTPVLVRVEDNNAPAIMHALDAGASGVIVPLVNSAEDAARAVSACRYPPEGTRSWGPVRAALGVSGYSPASANRHVICVVMVESAEGVAALDQILDVVGIDAVFIGPNDLALSTGVTPSFNSDDQRHAELVESIRRTCAARATVSGIAVGDVESAKLRHEQGFDMIALPSDMAMIMRTAKVSLEAMRPFAGLASEVAI